MEPVVEQGGSNIMELVEQGGDGQGSSEPVEQADGGQGVSVLGTTEESASVTNWHNIILFVLALIGAFLIIFGVAYAIVARAHSRKNKSTLDPNGAVTAVPVGEHVENEGKDNKSTFVAFCTSVYGTATCDFVAVTLKPDSDSVGHLGVWSFSHERDIQTPNKNYYQDSCYAYKSAVKEDQIYLYGEQNAALHTAQAASILVLFFGLISAGVALYMASTGSVTLRLVRVIFALSILCTFLQGLTLLVLKADTCVTEEDDEQMYYNCEVSFGGAYSIASLGYWFLAGCATLLQYLDP
eukprot:scaffold62148_cov62-Attheya_sp.AAC.3